MIASAIAAGLGKALGDQSRRRSASNPVSVLRKFNQGVDRQARILAGLDHQVAKRSDDLHRLDRPY